MPIQEIAPGQMFFHNVDFQQLRANAQQQWHVRVENGVPIDVVRDEPRPVPAHAKPPEANGPELWQKLLDAVNEIFELDYAAVAGGAVRDYLCGVDAKDIDIFVAQSDEKTVDDVLEEADQLGWGKLQYKPGVYQGKQKVTVFNAYVFGREVQLIFTAADTLEQHLDTFDFYINQCWYDGEIKQTAKAAYGINKKVWEPVGELAEITLKHFERVNKRVGIYSLNRGEPWYQKFNPVPKGPRK